jgi:GntR family transcriptional repressor for pyruvate dehydrogenase complex
MSLHEGPLSAPPLQVRRDAAAPSAINWREHAELPQAPTGERDRTHRRVLVVIEQLIVEGRLRAGDRLPGERELAEMLGVSRNSVREALRALESMDLVVREPGRGQASGCIITSGPARALSSVLRLHLALSHFSLEDLVDVRVQLEVQAVRRAAGRGLKQEAVKVDELLESMADTNLTPLEFNRLDTQFHITLSNASGNPLLISLMHALRDGVQQEMVAASERLDPWAPVATRLRLEHREIAEAVRAGDEGTAAALMDAHIHGFYGHMTS